MEKSILVIDEMNCCDMCKLGFENECSGEFECFMEPTKHIENPEGEKPDWCPLRKLPDRLPTTQGYDYPDGWNDCLDKLED